MHMRMCECEGGGTEERGTSSRVRVSSVCEGRREESPLSTHSLCCVLCACFVSVCVCVKGKARREESLSTHYFVCVDVSEFPTFKTLHVPDFDSKGLIPDLQPLCIVLARGNLPLLLPVKLERFLLSTSYFSSL